MIQELVSSPGEQSPEELHEAYLSELAGVVDAVGVALAAEETGIDASTLETLADDDGELTLSEAAAVLALSDGRPDAEAIRQEALDHVLLGMTTAVLDVEKIAANVDLGLSATGIQQRIEGRTPMTLREFAHVHGFVESRKR